MLTKNGEPENVAQNRANAREDIAQPLKVRAGDEKTGPEMRWV